MLLLGYMQKKNFREYLFPVLVRMSNFPRGRLLLLMRYNPCDVPLQFSLFGLMATLQFDFSFQASLLKSINMCILELDRFNLILLC